MRILFVTRAAPIANGRGVDRRAAQHLATLRRLGSVTMVLPGHAADRAADHGIDLEALDLERVIVRREQTLVDRTQHRYWDAKPGLLRRILRLRVRHDNDQRALPQDAARRAGEIGGGYDLLFAFRIASAVWIDSVLAASDRPRLAIADLDDVESVAFARLERERPRSLPDRLQGTLFSRWLRAEEARLARTWNALCVCSDHDAASLQRRFGISPLVVPNGVTFPPLSSPPPAGDAHVLFVGTLSYQPNAVGIRWFVEQAWPNVRAALSGRCRLSIVGMDPPDEIRALGDHPGVEVIGRVEDLTPVYAQATIVIVPIFSGGGTRIKLIEALALTRPVVTTTLGCEGLALENGRDTLIADSADAFAEAVVALADDPARAHAMAERGWRIGQSTYETGAIQARLVTDIRALAGADRTTTRSRYPEPTA